MKIILISKYPPHQKIVRSLFWISIVVQVNMFSSSLTNENETGYNQKTVAIFDAKGIYDKDKFPPSNVLKFSKKDEDETSWVALNIKTGPSWVILDLGAPMTFEKVETANSLNNPISDGWTKKFR